MWPCRDGFRKQMWFMDDFNFPYSRREIALGKCLDDDRTKRARFIYDKPRGVVYARECKIDLYLGLDPDDKNDEVRLFLEGTNDSLTTLFLF